MKRMILTGILAIGVGATCLMAQAPPPAPTAKAPAPKSKAELEALQALQAAVADPDKAIAAAENLITKFADTDFKGIALYVEADAYQRKGDYDHMLIFAERVLEVSPQDFRATERSLAFLCGCSPEFRKSVIAIQRNLERMYQKR